MAGEIAPVPGTDEAITSMNAAIADQVFVANLSGFAEVPPRQTDASGAVVVSLNPDGESLHYRLSVSNLQDITAAHLHLGLKDENGPIVVPLLGQGAPGDAATPPSGVADGIIAEGDISADNLTGPLADTPLVVLMELLRSGAIYANVHTTQYPGGEIRGQMQGVGPSVDGFVELLQEGDDGTEDDGTAGNGATGDGTSEDATTGAVANPSYSG